MSLSVGMGPPYALRVTCTGGSIDYTTVTAVAMFVEKPTRETVWSASIQAQSATALTAEHLMSKADLVDADAGTMRVFLDMTVPTGTLFSSTAEVEIVTR
jgi:hypothetical protein